MAKETKLNSVLRVTLYIQKSKFLYSVFNIPVYNSYQAARERERCSGLSPSPLFWVKIEEMTEGRKAGRAKKSTHDILSVEFG